MPKSYVLIALAVMAAGLAFVLLPSQGGPNASARHAPSDAGQSASMQSHRAEALVDEDRPGDATEIEIRMTSFGYHIGDRDRNATLTLEPGRRYDLTLVNASQVEHEADFGRDVKTTNGSPEGYRQFLLRDVPVELVGDGWRSETAGVKGVDVEPGATVHVVFTLPTGKAGQWAIGCFEPGHYDAGMHAPIAVK